MAKTAYFCIFISQLFFLLGSSSGTLVGFIYDARKSNAIPSADETMPLLKQNKVLHSQIRVLVADYTILKSFANRYVHVDLYLNDTIAKNLRHHKPFAVSWLKALTSAPHVKIKNIILSGSSSSKLSVLYSTLKSIHSILGGSNYQRRVKVSVSLSLAFLENSNEKQKRCLRKVFQFISRTRSFVAVEINTDEDLFGESMLRRVNLATDFLHNDDISLVLVYESSFCSENEIAEFDCRVSRSVKKVAKIRGKEIVGLLVQVSPIKDHMKMELERKDGQMFSASHRQLLSNMKNETSQHDSVYPPTTTFPTTPVTNPVTTPTINPVTPITVSPDNAAPGIVTVPGVNPVTVTPMPPSTPIPQPNTDPVNSPLPITNPVTTPNTNPGAQPVTNPVTTYPAPTTGVPVTTPVTTPVTPPATGNAPALSGQSWCVAKSGASQTALQAALDYACGTGVADCSVIQQSGSCYNPNTLQNHASYAFNSYYQKKPAQTSCDFGGAAMITNTNPSTGSCIYPSSSSPSSSSSPPTLPTPTSSSSPPTLPTPTSSPVSPTPVVPVPESPISETPTPTPTTAANGGAAIPGSDSPPAVLNASNPQPNSPIGFGDIPPSAYGESSPSVNSTTSMSMRVQPFIGCIILVTSVITGKFVINI